VANPYASGVYAGTEEVPDHLRIDLDRLRDWAAGRLPGLERDVTVGKFKGGQSNPTYRIGTDAGDYVLRRKPPGPLHPTAHAIDREFRVLSALEGTGVPIPRARLYCDDPEVIGSEFYIVDAVDGTVHWNCELPDRTPAYRRAFYTDLAANLGKLHALDWRALGLEDFGRHAGYVERNLRRWYNIYVDARTIAIADMDWAAAALKERLPAEEPIALIHGDYGTHNVIAAPAEPKVAAILDWEMSTIGNPLVDLAHAMRPWMEPPEPETGRPTLADKDLAALGIPSLENNIAAYQAQSGIEWRDGPFYLAFAMFRYACMVQGVLHRYAIGTAANRHFAHNRERVVVLARKARDILEATP
jgi:aminoglycoside phosphotransferase (APT) family kinase protein